MRHVVFDSAHGGTVQTRSCDQCFSRKVKCDRRSPCSKCLENDTQCRYERSRKRRCFRRPEPPGTPYQSALVSSGQSRNVSPDDGSANFHHQQDWTAEATGNAVARSSSIASTSAGEVNFEDATVDASGVALTPVYYGGHTATLPFDMEEFLYYTNDLNGPEITGWVPQLPIRLSETPQLGLSPFPSMITSHNATLDSLLLDSSISQLIEIFLERLQHSMPFFTRSFIRQNIASGRHIHDRSFGSLVQAICSLVLLQPVQSQDERPWPNREARADAHLALAVRLHSQANLGQSPTLETIMTSVFLFACQFCKGNFDAARFRLREASVLAEVMKLDNPESYGHISDTEKQRRIRTFIGLTIIERIYSVQRDYLPGTNILSRTKLKELQDAIASSPDRSESENIIALEGLDSMLDQVDFIDTKMIKCWKGMCWGEFPQTHVSHDTILHLLRRYQIPPPLSWQADIDNHAQHADILVTRHWMRIKLWSLANSHGYVNNASDHPEFRQQHALTIAHEALDTCSQFQMTSLEVHGVGLIEKLSDIATCASRQIDDLSAVQDQPSAWDPSQVADGHQSSPNVSGSPAGSSQNTTHALNEAEITLNGYLALFASFRRGKHPFLRPFMRILSDINFER